MTSDARVIPYVWTFLRGRPEPVVAGVLAPSTSSQGLAFQYAASYLARTDALTLGPDMPLGDKPIPPAFGHGMPSSIRDAMPDSWGRQVINRALGLDPEDTLSDVRYMLESGSDRVGAIDFQASPREYAPRTGGGSLTMIETGVLIVESEDDAGPQLASAIRNTLTAAGGSQPKAYVEYDSRSWLAKFQTSYDQTSPLIKAERAALYVAQKAGIDVPDAELVRLEGDRMVLLTERFDRERLAGSADTARKMIISGMTVAEEYRASGGSYPSLVEKLRRVSATPEDAGRELFRRLAFRIAMRIDDDHLRNVGFFWDGEHASFTPAFDLSPDLVSTPTGLTDLGGGTREFSLPALVAQHDHYHLGAGEAHQIADQMISAVVDHRPDAAEAAMMLRHEREMLLTRTATPALIGRSTSSARKRTIAQRFPELIADTSTKDTEPDGPALG